MFLLPVCIPAGSAPASGSTEDGPSCDDSAGRPLTMPLCVAVDNNPGVWDSSSRASVLRVRFCRGARASGTGLLCVTCRACLTGCIVVLPESGGANLAISWTHTLSARLQTAKHISSHLMWFPSALRIRSFMGPLRPTGGFRPEQPAWLSTRAQEPPEDALTTPPIHPL